MGKSGHVVSSHVGCDAPTCCMMCNSIPPERVFSILNNTFDDDQDRSFADYIELSLQLQFNARSRSAE
jgi:hypothetical protein